MSARTHIMSRVGQRPVAESRRIDWRKIDALQIKRMTADSRQVRRGDTFVAYPGQSQDGRDYIAQAIARGAASVLWERQSFRWNPAWHVDNLAIPGLKKHAGEIASRVYGHPSASLWMIGVTGTNGKTSCSQWIAQSLTRSKRKCVVIGTLGTGFPGRLESAVNTTPDAVWLQGRLSALLTHGAKAASMEVSSIGVHQHRVAGVKFDVAMLTNVSRDHLEYHGTMRNYRAAKARLFAWPTLKYAVLNLDDEFGMALASRDYAAGTTPLGYGFAHTRALTNRRLLRIQGRNLCVDAGGICFDVLTPWGSASLESRLIGRFNASNLLGSLAVLLASDVSLADSVAALRAVKAVPGRTERYGGGRRPLVLVDYAHTPDALKSILMAVREMLGSGVARASRRQSRPDASREAQGARLICVFGCGGERDRGKRPLMGAIAARLADHVVVTSDNPRTEDPREIIADIVSGLPPACYTVESDRRQAIRVALRMARRGDVVVIAGKGHEAYQEICGKRRPFSDAAEVRAALQEQVR